MVTTAGESASADPRPAVRAEPPVATSRPPGTRRRPVPRLPKLPSFVGRLCFVAATLLLLRLIFPGVFWLMVVVDAFSTIFVPIDGGSLGLVVGLFIVGAALIRRKRVGWTIAMIAAGLILLADLVVIVLLVLGSLLVTAEFVDLAALARAAFNLASLGALTWFMIVHRAEFSARRTPGNLAKALLTLGIGTVVTVGLGLLLTTIFPNDLAGPRGRLGWVINRIVAAVFGEESDAIPSNPGPPSWINGVLGVLIAATLIAALLVLVRSQRRAGWMEPADEPRVRALVAQSPADSLAYFNTRRDKSVVFAASGRSAISYRVGLGVCLASSDPLGPPDHWRGAIDAWFGQIDTYGWTPAVIGASEAGATAYAQAGLKVIRLGDEAVLDPREFHLDGRDLRPVRQAVTRLERLGYHTRIRRHRDIAPDELHQLIAKTDAWRDTESERGFSMALGRLGDPGDGDCLMVEALFPSALAQPGPAGDVAGILSFVPWGTDGFSLDVMRRSPQAGNGVTELMVSALMTAGRELGVRQVSLNFAVFRSAFEEGARIGAGPFVRLFRRGLLVASRWWQIESLFRSNVKYHPEWRPRFLCYLEARDIAMVGLASGVAEGFIDLPGFLGQHQEPPPRLPGPPAAILSAPVPAVEQGPRVPEQTRLRMGIRENVLAEGGEPYPTTFRPTAPCAQLRLGEQVRAAGRVLAIRDFGGLIFVKLQDWSGAIQLLLSRETAGAAALSSFRRVINIGDHLGAEGEVVLSRNGELSVAARSWTLTAKALRPLPDKHRGFTDPEARVRQRYLDLTMNSSARRRLRSRSATIRAVRETLQGHGFLEVETPILQTIHGGANARPFRTHINAYDLGLYLRIAPELYLKRLMVGGVDKIFEIGRNFRNEGADATHNPEFTMLEAYEAYGDYTTMREVVQNIIRNAALAANDTLIIKGRDAHGVEHEVDLGEPFAVTTVNEAISAAAGVEITADTEKSALIRLADSLRINIDDNWTRGNILLELYEHLCEHPTVAPTFYCDFPAEVSPLTRQHRVDPRLAERWDLVCFGAEIGTAYSELVDPVIQRERLTEQSLQAAGGDPEAMELDEDFLQALEYAMPPSGGLGMGVDRLIMMLTESTIRETIAFPLVRPRG